jgi:hypothetical protein
MMLNQENAQTRSLEIYIIISHWMFLRVSVHKGPSSGSTTKAVSHKTKLATFVHIYTTILYKEMLHFTYLTLYTMSVVYKCG